MGTSSATKIAIGASGSIALALAVATPFVTKWEGLRTEPYYDIVGVKTVCVGETRVEMRRYTPAQCMAMLQRALKDDWVPAILDCTPGLADRPYQLAAAISFTHNFGARNYCASSIARRFNARDWRGGCDALLMWNKAGRPLKFVQGLDNRRRDERALCLKGVA